MYYARPVQLFAGMWSSGIFLNCNVYHNCTNNCQYCYVQWNRTDLRRSTEGDPKGPEKFARLLDRVFGPKYDDANALHFFMHNKFPMMLSNNSDCFCAFEVETGMTLEYLKVLAQLDYPIQILTKASAWPRLDKDAYLDVMSKFSRIWVAVTITGDNEACQQKWEPNAGSYDERFQLIRDCHSAGIPVEVHLVPFIFGDSFPSGEWDDPATYVPFIERCKEAGAYGIAIGPLSIGINDVRVCAPFVKEWAKQNQWARSEVDKRYCYWFPDVSIWQTLAEIWYSECKARGLQCGVHQAFQSLVADDGDLDGILCGPPWLDRSLSWLNASYVLRSASRERGTMVVTTTGTIADIITEACPWREHAFRRSTLGGCFPRSRRGYYEAGPMPEELTVRDLIHLQLQLAGGWSDSLWADQATKRVYEERNGDIVTIFDPESKDYWLVYDASQPREQWAVATPEYPGIPLDDLTD